MLPPTDCFIEFPRRDFPRLTHFGLAHESSIGDVDLHRHPGYEVKYFFEGRGTLQVGRERVINIDENDVVVTAPGFEHTFKLRGSGISFYWLGFQTGERVQQAGNTSLLPQRSRSQRPAFDNSFLRQLDGDAFELADAIAVTGYTFVRRFPELHEVFRGLADELREGRKYARQMVYLKVMELFTLIGRRMSGADHDHATPMQRVRRYIESNFDTSVTLAALSRVSGLTPAYISRRFRQEFGSSPIAFLNAYRIERAKVLLAEGESVTRTAQRCGYADMHYFSGLFKRCVGMPPSVYARASLDARGKKGVASREG